MWLPSAFSECVQSSLSSQVVVVFAWDQRLSYLRVFDLPSASLVCVFSHSPPPPFSEGSFDQGLCMERVVLSLSDPITSQIASHHRKPFASLTLFPSSTSPVRSPPRFVFLSSSPRVAWLPHVLLPADCCTPDHSCCFICPPTITDKSIG